MSFVSKSILGLVVLGVSVPAFAIPGPHLHARAEMQALLNYKETNNPGNQKVIFWGDLISIVKTGQDADHNPIYVVKSENGGEICSEVSVYSRMATPPPGKRSTDLVDARVLSVKRAACP